MTGDHRLYAPSVARNREAIASVLGPRLPESGLVLEIASGSGEHTVHLASAHPGLTFQPSDRDPEARASIDAWVAHMGLANVRPAITIDTTETFAPVTAADVVVCINMIHISPWASTVGLMRNAAAVLSPGGFLYLYGPYRRDGAHTAPSNAAFDVDLRSRNADWGIRDLEAVANLAAEHGFDTPDVIAMPANNFSVVFRRE